jgi:hypothetical protein
MRPGWTILAVALAGGAGCLFPSLGSLGGTPDASDASTDGGVEAAATSYCSTVDATFCDDFDEENGPVFTKWGSLEAADAGTLLRVDSGLSAPNAVAITIAASASTGQPAEELGHDVSGVVSHIHFSYDLVVDQYDTTSGSRVELSALTIDIGGNELGVREELVQSGLTCAAAVYPGDAGSTFPIIGNETTVSTGVWHHLDVVVDLTQTPATASFTFDGTSEATDAPIAGATFGPGILSLAAGVYYATEPTTGWRFWFDNFALWAN